MNLLDRIGIDLGRKVRLEEGVELAARHGIRCIDIQLDTGENAFDRFDASRCAGIRRACETHGIRLGLHTSSAVNVAEYAPVVADAVDRYLEAYLAVYQDLHVQWIVLHAGYHFSSDKPQRMEAGLARIQRLVERAPSVWARHYCWKTSTRNRRMPRCTTLRIRSRSGATTTTGSIHRAFGFRSPPITHIWSRTVSTASSMRSTSRALRRFDLRIAGATGMKSTSSRGAEISISGRCSGASRRPVSAATTRMLSEAWRT